jgi:hypothetical protein
LAVQQEGDPFWVLTSSDRNWKNPATLTCKKQQTRPSLEYRMVIKLGVTFARNSTMFKVCNVEMV